MNTTKKICGGGETVFQCGDMVLYGSHGICQILDVETKKIDRKSIEYFVLQPIEQPGAKFYIPTQNTAALSKLRPLLTSKELDALLYEQAKCSPDWIEDESKRKQQYKDLISSGDRAALLSMIHALYKHRQLQLSAGRKFHLCDENFLRDAEKLLNTEFALVLGIQPEEVGAYVRKALNIEY